jgi:putative FmdB family regulatory protein
MPTYEYLCEGCGKKFELEQRITEDPIKKCVHCGKAKAKRLITQGNFILKGGGWYSDLYSSSSASKSKTPPAADAKATSKKSTPASSESKPSADKPSAKPTSKDKKASG